MKTSKSILFLFTLTFLFLIASCSKDNVSPSDSNTGVGTLSAKIDGQTFESETASGDLDTDGVLVIGGNHNSNVIALSLYFNSGQSVEEGTYNYTGLGCFASPEICGKIDYIATSNNTNTLYTSLAGGSSEIIITSIDFKSGGFAVGTFSGSIPTMDNSDVVTIADGQFNIKID